MKFFYRAALAFLFIFVFFTTIFIVPASAQTNQSITPNYISNETNPDVPQNLHSLTQIVTTEVLSTMICQLVGVDVIKHTQSCLGIDPQTHRIGFVSNGSGAIGLVMQGISFTMNTPVHSGDYVTYMADKFGAEKTYAQTPNGVGFAGLHPLLGLWVAFRNIVYLFFVIIFVLIGIAIMLQVQIDPRTVMTLENQLPKIIIGIILVTFSYAISGVLVDAMWIFTFLVINVLAGTDTVVPNLAHTATINVLQFPLTYLNEVLKNGDAGLLALAGGAVQAVQALVTNMFHQNGLQSFGIATPVKAGCAGWMDVGCNLGKFADFATNTLADILTAILSWVLGLLVGLVILIALLITMFRIWFMLLRAYMYVILDVILAPFHIAAGLVPGSSLGFGSWFRSMVANLSSFPITVAMFVLARVLVDSFFPNGVGNTTTISGINAPGVSLFIPPLVGNPNGVGSAAGAGAGYISPLGAFLALAVIFAIPEVLNTTRNALKTINSTMSAAAMGNMGAGGKVLSGGIRSFTAGFIDPASGRFTGGFRPGRLLSRI